MDKINSKTDGPIDGKKGDGRLLMIINRILFFLLPDLSNSCKATLYSEFQFIVILLEVAWSWVLQNIVIAKHSSLFIVPDIFLDKTITARKEDQPSEFLYFLPEVWFNIFLKQLYWDNGENLSNWKLEHP